MNYSFVEEPFLLATRTYWDVYGAEAESKTLEEKLKTLGRFVQEGGDIANVVELYVDGREDQSQLEAVQWAIFYYLEYMINARESLQPYEYTPTALRIMRLEKEELLELLEKELKRCVTVGCKGEVEITGVEHPNDKNLDFIERRHWRTHPEESIYTYDGKTRRWDRRLPGLWCSNKKI